jgi:hypothetical protein
VQLFLLVGRAVERRADKPDKHEVIEVASLQAGVLAIVSERQELSGLVVKVGLGAQGPHHRLGQHGDSTGTALGAQAGHPGELRLLGALVGGLAGRAEVQAFEERHRQALVDDGAELIELVPERQAAGPRFVQAVLLAIDDDPVGGEPVEQRRVVGGGHASSVRYSRPVASACSPRVSLSVRGLNFPACLSRLTTRKSWPHSRQKASGNNGRPGSPRGALRW